MCFFFALSSFLQKVRQEAAEAGGGDGEGGETGEGGCGGGGKAMLRGGRAMSIPEILEEWGLLGVSFSI